MSDTVFDQAVISAAFGLAARKWVVRRLAWRPPRGRRGCRWKQARARFAGRDAILLRFGRFADQAALTGVTEDGSPRDRLFDMLMRRFDAMQT